MKLHVALFLFLSSLGSLPCQALILFPHQSYKIKLEQGQSIHIGDGKILKAKDRETHIEIIAKKIGRTHLQIDGPPSARTLSINIVSKKDYVTYKKLASYVKRRNDLRLIYQNKKIILTGQLWLLEDWIDLRKLFPLPSSYAMAAKMDEALWAQAKNWLHNYLLSQSLPCLSFVKNDRIQALLPKRHKNLKKRYQKALYALGVDIVDDHQNFEFLPLVRTEILVAEIKKGAMSNIGLRPPTQISAQLIPEFGVLSDNPNSIASLNFLEQKGWGQILASPTLLSRSGNEANFMAGGEFPIRTLGARGGSVIFKKYGVLLKVTPQVNFRGWMNIALETEVSTLDFAHAVNGVPGLLVNRVSNQFNLKGSETIALSGLLQSEKGRNREGWPLLSRIPILGRLFSSQSYRRSESELIIFVTPKLIHTSQGENQCH